MLNVVGMNVRCKEYSFVSTLHKKWIISVIRNIVSKWVELRRKPRSYSTFVTSKSAAY